MTIVTSPFPPYQNLPIQPEFYKPNFFDIEAISFGLTTLVTTTENHNFSIGSQVRFHIPERYGTTELSNVTVIVRNIPQADQFTFDVQSTSFTPFIAEPFTATITNITQATNAVFTANNSFHLHDLVKIDEVLGMTQINEKKVSIIAANATSFTVFFDTTNYSAYISGGTAEFFPTYPKATVAAIGDINSGAINMDKTNQQLYIDGSFINISPE